MHGEDPCYQIIQAHASLETLKIWLLRHIAAQNNIIPRASKRKKQDWIKAIEERQEAMGYKEGDQVIIFGKERSAEKLANNAGNISYELITSISQRVKRLIIDYIS